MPSSYRFVVVDVFTDTPLQGNQLAVFTNAQEIPEGLLQRLAKEVGFSETVFVYPPTRRARGGGTAQQGALHRENDDETVFVYPAAGEGHVRIRIFTPAQELPFAGHPILGTAFVLAAPMQLGTIALETGAGVVPVDLTRDESGRIVFGWMGQPVPSWEPFAADDALLAALGLERSGLPVEVYDNGVEHVYVELDSPEDVARLIPDLGALGRFPVGVNCFAGGGSRWKTRMFGPALGVAEDPGTGSAAGPLAVHVARHGRIAFGDEIRIEQGAEIDRPCVLHARVAGSAERVDRVEVGGSAVVVARGEFRLPTGLA